jgi:hypothetical protein
LKTQQLTLGGILTALTLIFLYLGSIIETNTLTLLTLASFMVPIGLMRGDLRTAGLIYVSSSLLSFFIVPLNTSLIYTFFFGIYGLMKYFIERTQNLLFEIFLKLILFNSIVSLFIIFMPAMLGHSFFNGLSNYITRYLPFNSRSISFIIIWFTLQFGFFIFDYALTLLIHYYRKYASKF